MSVHRTKPSRLSRYVLFALDGFITCSIGRGVDVFLAESGGRVLRGLAAPLAAAMAWWKTGDVEILTALLASVVILMFDHQPARVF